MYIPPHTVLIQARGNFLCGLIFHGAGEKIASAEAKPLHKHADTVCRSHQLNREKGVERVEDPSQVQGRALLGSRGSAPWVPAINTRALYESVTN